jgi:hypothetical protein
VLSSAPRRSTPEGRLAGEDASRFVGEQQHPVGIDEQPFAALRQSQPTALAGEELDADRCFELLDARRDIGRNAMQSPGRPHDAAFAGDGAKDVKIGKLHRGHLNLFSNKE